MASEPSRQAAARREASDQREIRRYVERLFNCAERVTQIEALFSAAAARAGYSVWDVRTDRGRWWVIGPPLNLYAQELLPNLDYAIGLHHTLFGGDRAEQRQ